MPRPTAPLLLALLGGGAAAHAQGAAEPLSLSLADAWALALRQNLDLQRAGLDLESARVALQSARGADDPSLSVGVDRSRASAASNDPADGVEVVRADAVGWSVGLSQALPTGGTATLSWSESTSDSNSAGTVLSASTADSAWLGLSQPLLGGLGPAVARSAQRGARLDLSAAALAHRAAAEALVLEVADAYWSLVAERERHVLATRALDIAEEELADTRERQAEGFAGSGDVLQVERAVGGARQSLVLADASLEAAQTRLGRALGLDLRQRPRLLPTDRPFQPESSPDPARSLALALDQNATWLRARLSAEQARLDAAEARWTHLPSLDASAGLGRSGLAAVSPDSRQQVLDGDQPSWALGLDLSVDLPARTLVAARREAGLDAARAALDLQDAEQELQVSVEAAVRAVVRDRSRARLADQTLDAARQGLEADQELLRDGRGSTRDVVRSLEALQAAEVDALEAQIALQQAILNLLAVEGRLLSTFGLAPGEP